MKTGFLTGILLLCVALLGCSSESKQEYGNAATDVGNAVRTDANTAKAAADNAAMTAKIKTSLTSANGINAHAIDVDTVGSTITLTGTVGTEAEKTQAAEVAHSQAGPDYTIVNNLTLKAPGAGQ